ncbi:hypothetical protein MTO96_018519 [Rhipicephalus appendiculatus]
MGLSIIVILAQTSLVTETLAKYRLEDDYEDSSGSKNAKYATVSQSLNGGVASGSTAPVRRRLLRPALREHLFAHAVAGLSVFHRGGLREHAGGRKLHGADLRLGDAFRSLPARLEYGQGSRPPRLQAVYIMYSANAQDVLEQTRCRLFRTRSRR